ncbi:MAG: hypothetical protein ACK5Z2_07545 [Bacteroidota bacterium]
MLNNTKECSDFALQHKKAIFTGKFGTEENLQKAYHLYWEVLRIKQKKKKSYKQILNQTLRKNHFKWLFISDGNFRFNQTSVSNLIGSTITGLNYFFLNTENYFEIPTKTVDKTIKY